LTGRITVYIDVSQQRMFTSILYIDKPIYFATMHDYTPYS